jgi:glucose-6-phosphate isomerase
MSAPTALTQSPAWQALREHRRATANLRLLEAFEQDPARFEHFSLRCGDLLLDFSKNLVTAETLRLLAELGRERGLEARIADMFRGARINSTENRAVLHVALRTDRPVMFEGADVAREAARTFARMRTFCEGVRGGSLTGYSGRPFTDVVNIGIGGSDLGPALVAEALTPYAAQNLDIHFVSNVDGAQLANVLARLNAETTLFIVASKTFTTLETLANARTAREWLFSKTGNTKAAARHFAAVTANVPAAREFGVDPGGTFELWDWVGGRYSVWSAVGLAAAVAIGMDNFDALRAGAGEMDRHFATAPLDVMGWS